MFSLKFPNKLDEKKYLDILRDVVSHASYNQRFIEVIKLMLEKGLAPNKHSLASYVIDNISQLLPGLEIKPDANGHYTIEDGEKIYKELATLEIGEPQQRRNI